MIRFSIFLKVIIIFSFAFQSLAKEFSSDSNECIATPRILVLADNEFQGSGTGALISSKGYILTNFHLASSRLGNKHELNRKQFKVLFKKNDVVYVFNATPIHWERNVDLLLLQLTNKDFQNKKIDNISDILKVEPFKIRTKKPSLGENIYALGYPGVLDRLNESDTNIQIQNKNGYRYSNHSTFLDLVNISLTQGQISRIDKDIIYHGAKIDHGNSGGPLLDDEGYLIGINTAGKTDASTHYIAINSQIITKFLPDSFSRNCSFDSNSPKNSLQEKQDFVPKNSPQPNSSEFTPEDDSLVFSKLLHVFAKTLIFLFFLSLLFLVYSLFTIKRTIKTSGIPQLAFYISTSIFILSILIFFLINPVNLIIKSDLGNSVAQYQLSKLYLDPNSSFGLDKVRSKELLSKSASNGNTLAQIDYAKLLYQSAKNESDPILADAYHYACLAEEKNSLEASEICCNILSKKKVSPKEFRPHLEKLADKNHKLACEKLGVFHLKMGDKPLAIPYLEKASRLGSKDSTLILGLIHYKDRKINSLNLNKAKYYFELAERQNHPEARKILNECFK